MPTPKECRQHAEECLKLAKETTQIYARQALLEPSLRWQSSRTLTPETRKTRRAGVVQPYDA
jgi:hypothetical protein